ncbi:MAG TPA: outer membrane protein transport protein, partial [Polyangia bacterium]
PMASRGLSTAVALATLLVAAARAHAGGFELVEQSPAAVATAGAQTADADAAAAVYYDPAALAFQPGTTALGGANLVVYRGSATAAAGAADSTGLYATPTLFGGVRVAPRYAVGIGVFDPFAWSLSYPAGWAGRMSGTSFELHAYAVNPSVAFRPWRWLALGFGVDIVPTTLGYRRATALGGGAEGELAIDVSGTGVGGNAALFVRVVPRWLDVAVAYRSAIDLDLSSSAAHGTLPLPHALSFAVASRPVAGLTLTTDVRLTLWSDLRALSFTFSDMTTPKETITLDYADAVGVRVGAAYRFWRAGDGEPRLAVRLGGGWDQGPTSAAATSPLLPDGDRILVGGGVGARFGAFAIDAGYLAAIASELLGADGTFVARYRAVTHTISVALTLRLPNFPSRLDDAALQR